MNNVHMQLIPLTTPSVLTPFDRSGISSPNRVGGMMSDDRPNLLQGTLDLLVLKTLTWGAMHGYGIASLIHQHTDGDITIVDAALYKALHRLERDEYVASAWGITENNRRAKYYQLTPAGRRRLRDELAGWRNYSAAVERLLGTA